MKSEISNESLAQIVSVLNNYLSSINRKPHSLSTSCHNNVTLVWLNPNSTTPVFAYSKPFVPAAHEDDQLQAVLYIVVVLMFYSVTIATAMIKYMYQESQQATEDQMYQDFLTKTKQLAIQQAKMEFARRVSVQLVAMSQAFNGRQSTIASVSRRSTLPVVAEIDPQCEEDCGLVATEDAMQTEGSKLIKCDIGAPPHCAHNEQERSPTHANEWRGWPRVSGLCAPTARRVRPAAVTEPISRLSAL